MDRLRTQDTDLESKLILISVRLFVNQCRLCGNMSSSRTYHASEVISVMVFVGIIYLYYIGLHSTLFVRQPDPGEGITNCLQASIFSIIEKPLEKREMF